MGRKSAKHEMQLDKMSELSIRNRQAIADALSKRVCLLEEQKELQAFSITEWVAAEDRAERDEFFRLMRAANIKRLCEEAGEFITMEQPTKNQSLDEVVCESEAAIYLCWHHRIM